MTAIRDLAGFNAVHDAGLAKLLPPRPRIAVGMGTCGSGNGAEAVMHGFAEAVDQRGLGIDLVRTGCFGFCAEEPLVNVRLPGQPLVILHRVQVNHVERILDDVAAKTVPADLALCRIEEWNHLTSHIHYGSGLSDIPLWNEVPFFRGQKKIVLRNAGLINPDDVEEYIAVGGYQALYKVLIDAKPEAANDQIKESGLRGRGGAGYSAGQKWEFLRKAAAERKFLICNADEGDPGAYMNRNEIESDPHALIEGMAIGAYITGATDGVIYIRAEYPLAVHQLKVAIGQAREYGLLGKDILGRGFAFDIDVVEGAGAFVCGEETALIASLEGRAGRPRPRPPFPAQKGVWGYPTNINNVETWFNIAPIIALGPAWFSETGGGASSGTKVFSLVGNPACLLHDMGEGHPERPERMRVIDRAMESEAFQMLARDVAPRAEISTIARVHPLDYIEAIRAASPTHGHTAIDGETSMSPGSFEAALRSAGGAIFAVGEVMTRKVRNAFVATRPPARFG